MDWRNYIVSDEKILVGKPTIKGTRISVAHIFSLFAEGWSEQQILENYPRVSAASIQAVLSSPFNLNHNSCI